MAKQFLHCIPLYASPPVLLHYITAFGISFFFFSLSFFLEGKDKDIGNWEWRMERVSRLIPFHHFQLTLDWQWKGRYIVYSYLFTKMYVSCHVSGSWLILCLYLCFNFYIFGSFWKTAFYYDQEAVQLILNKLYYRCLYSVQVDGGLSWFIEKNSHNQSHIIKKNKKKIKKVRGYFYSVVLVDLYLVSVTNKNEKIILKFYNKSA